MDGTVVGALNENGNSLDASGAVGQPVVWNGDSTGTIENE